MMRVTFVDDTTADYPSAETWVLMKGVGSAGHPPTFTADIELRSEDGSPVAIVGAGTFKAIEKSEPLPA